MLAKILLIIATLVSGGLLLFNRRDTGENQDMSRDLPNEQQEQEKVVTPKGTTIDLSNRGLSKLPSNVLSSRNVEVLDISNNNIEGALPSEIGKLQNLRVLDASNNDMTGLPAELGQLRNLEILDVSNNQLTGLPYELGNLQKLKELNLSGNNYAEQDLQIIRNSLPSTTEIIL